MDKDKKLFIYDKRTKDFILRLYDKYRVGMLKLAFSKLSDWHEAEDAVEEAFIKLAINYEKIIYSEEYEIKKYLVNTVINTTYKIIEKNKRNDYSDMDTIEELSQSTDSTEEIVISEISYDELRNLVNELKNPRYRLILNMKYMGYNNKEIAEELNVKSGTVRVMLLRIRSYLKKSKEGSHND